SDDRDHGVGPAARLRGHQRARSAGTPQRARVARGVGVVARQVPAVMRPRWRSGLVGGSHFFLDSCPRYPPNQAIALPCCPAEVVMKRRRTLIVVALGVMAAAGLIAAQKPKADGNLLLLDWAAKSSLDTPPVAVLVEMGTKDTEPTKWDGKATVKG